MENAKSLDTELLTHMNAQTVEGLVPGIRRGHLKFGNEPTVNLEDKKVSYKPRMTDEEYAHYRSLPPAERKRIRKKRHREAWLARVASREGVNAAPVRARFRRLQHLQLQARINNGG